MESGVWEGKEFCWIRDPFLAFQHGSRLGRCFVGGGGIGEGARGSL